MALAAARSGPTRADNHRQALSLAALIALAVGAPVLAAGLSGALTIPRNDDWVYSRIAEHWYASGHLDVLGWTPTTLIGHLLWGLPFIGVFGSSTATLHWAGAAAGAVALVGIHDALRRLAPGGGALFGTALVAACPCFALLAPTYMTDLTALAAQAWCLALGLRALNAGGRTRATLLSASLLIGLLGFATREQALAAPLAVLAAQAVTERRRTALAAATFAAGTVAFYAWRHGLPGGTSYGIRRPTRHSVELAGRAAFTLGLFALPLTAALLGRRPRDLGKAGRLAGAVTALIGVVVLAVAVARGRSPDLLVGNLLTRSGPLDGAVISGSRPELLPGALWWGSSALAVAGAAALAAAATQTAIRGRSSAPAEPKAVAALAFVALAAAAVLFGALTRSVFDRYLLPVLFGLVLVAALQPRTAPPRHAVAATGLALLAILSALSVTAGNAFDVARWRAGEQATRAGVAATAVDAGYEWVGAHYPGRLAESRPPRALPPVPWYLKDVFPRARNCVTVSDSPLQADGLHPTGTRAYRSVPWGARHRLRLYSRARC